jgi:hypothetical protein
MTVRQLSDGNSDGTTLGQSSTDKIAFYGATPIVRPAAIADATDAATVITRANAILAQLRNLGLIAT